MAQSSEKKNTPLSAMFLVGGTCIGGGILILPIVSGAGGFFPSLVMMTLCWLAMTLSALLLLEVSLWMEEGAHVITMTSRILGRVGEAVAWLLYLYVCYASLVAYTAGGGVQIAEAIEWGLGHVLSKEITCSLFMLVFGMVIYIGASFVGRVNSILFISLVLAYFGLVGNGLDEIHPHFLLRMHWRYSLMAMPVLLTAFSFQTMVPSLTPYLKRNARALRMAIIGGTSIAFFIYAVWQCVLLGIVPFEGQKGLAEALISGDLPATHFLRQHVIGYWVVAIAEFFAFFAIVTSFLGIALGLFDFLSDGLKIKKEGMGKVVLGLLIAVPTVFFAVYYERVFITALDTTGGFGDTILNGIIPVLLVWIGRYHLGYQGKRMVPFGRPMLLLIGLFFLTVFVQEVLSVSGVINSVFRPEVFAE